MTLAGIEGSEIVVKVTIAIIGPMKLLTNTLQKTRLFQRFGIPLLRECHMH